MNVETAASTCLPPGWAWATLGELCDVIGGLTVDAKRAGPGHIELPYLRVANVQRGHLDLSKMRTILVPEARVSHLLLERGDVLLNEGGDRDKVGRGWVWEGQIPRCTFQNHVFRARVRDNVVCPYFLSFYLNEFGREHFLSGAKQTTNLASIALSAVKAAPITVPPRADQDRIVAAVNALFEEVGIGEGALARAREGLTQFRASLLHAAYTGALTANWRAANQTNETGHDLLAELLDQRRARWEADFRAKAALAGKQLRDDTWKARYPTPRSPDLTDTPELPDGWTWAALDQLAHDSNYGTSVKCDADADGLAVLRIPNVQAGAVTWSNLKFATNDLGLNATDLLAPGDLLVVRTNGSHDLVGRAALIEGARERPAYFASYLIRFRLLGSATVRRWVASVFRSGLVRTQVARFAATSAGQYNVSQTKLAGFAIPLPPESEIEAALDALTEAAADDGALPSVGFADQLRQSILHAAFTGRLVPQDPSDEPTAALLARLRAAPPTTHRPRQRRAAARPDLLETQA